ncbi:hypothetical protein N8D56_09965 [Devosia sp. A8/3-2]|nr:hypothetical protein N8D56_09965 [Devosia sp. A8/3-2]
MNPDSRSRSSTRARPSRPDDISRLGRPRAVYLRSLPKCCAHITTKPPGSCKAQCHSTPPPSPALVWLDLLQPTAEEDRLVETLLGITIPTRAEMEEIELSARLYSEDGAEFMTMTGLHQLDTDEPGKTPITFILKGETLVTVRYAEPKPFSAFTLRAQRPRAAPAARANRCFWACSKP